MFHVLMRDATFDPSRLRSLRSGIIAGGPVSEILADRGRARCDVEIACGLSEIGPAVDDVAFVTRRSSAPDGCFLSGDLGIIDEDGYVRVVGRRRDTILRGEREVRPREVNDQLRAYPVVDDPCVTGGPHDILGELVSACVISVPDLVRFLHPRPMTGRGPAKRRTLECEPALDHTAFIGSS
jgi:fatty-acyl-CoA synthase